MKSTAAIRADIAALDGHAEALQARADEISLAAVSGDEDARRELASVVRSIDQTTAERVVLSTALDQAKEREAEAQRAADAATRERHRAEAGQAASRALSAGEKADRLVTEFVACVAELAEAERDIHTALRAAGEPAGTAIIGRINASVIAVERMAAAVSGKLHRLSDQRSLGAILLNAWDELLPLPEEI